MTTLARDIMTREVVSVSPNTPIREIAALLAAKRISAVPVVDEVGMPIGMVSEGDLISRNETDRESRHDWWLDMLAQGDTSTPDHVASLHASGATAAIVMSAPVITVEETTEISEIARLLEEYRVKRVPVLRDNHIVGIVSRADLVRTLASVAVSPKDGRPAAAHGLFDAIIALDDRFHGGQTTAPRAQAIAPATPINTALSAQRFRQMVADYRHHEYEHRDDLQREAARHLQDQLKEWAKRHVDDDYWRRTLARAIEAAERGEKEYLLLRFPSALCSDAGRAINVPSPDWPETLRGESAEIYLRWEHDLKPHGFHLNARVLEFPDGFPGDIGLFLGWQA